MKWVCLLKKPAPITFTIVAALLLITASNSTSFAAESDVSLRSEAIGEQKSSYTAVTDLFDVDLLSDRYTDIQQRYQQFVDAEREKRVDRLFYAQTTVQADAENQVLDRAQALRLFENTDNSKIYAPNVTGAEKQNSWNMVIISVVIVLCIAALSISNYQYKQRKRERAALVHNSDYANK